MSWSVHEVLMPDAQPPSLYLYDPALCPLTATLEVIGGKWKGLIWWRLSAGLGRFNELHRAMPQITRKVLVQQLRDLERDGIVQRTVHPGVPARVDYTLTDYGRTLEPLIDAICRWGEAHRLRETTRGPASAGSG